MISHLLLSGHARVGDLVQAYGFDPVSNAKANGLEKKEMLNGFQRNHPTEHGSMARSDCATLESLNHTLCDLLQAQLIHKVNESHFHTDADNRTEAERQTVQPGEYKGQTKREREALWQHAVRNKLDGWNHGTLAEARDIIALQKGVKRPLEYSGELLSNKRQRLDLTLSREVISSTGIDYQNSIVHAGFLKVWL